MSRIPTRRRAPTATHERTCRRSDARSTAAPASRIEAVPVRLWPLAVAQRLDDLPLVHPHEVHAAVCLLAVDPPTNDRAIAVHVDVLDLEPDGRVGGRCLPAGEALVVPRPEVAVWRRTNAFHDAVVGNDVDEPFGRSQQEGLVELLDERRGVSHARIVRPIVSSGNSSKGMATHSFTMRPTKAERVAPGPAVADRARKH